MSAIEENATLHVPIVYGSIAFWLGRKADDMHTHKWTLYIRGPQHENLNYCISKVVFTLHPSFAEPVRELREPPFEVTEFGWGEFEAQIAIHFKSSDDKPVVIPHVIKLYPGDTRQQLTTRKPVVNEFYDEITFTNPEAPLRESLLRSRTHPLPSVESELREHLTSVSDAEDVQRLSFAQSYVTGQLESTRAHIARLDAEIAQLTG